MLMPMAHLRCGPIFICGGGEKMQKFTLRMPDWIHTALQQLAHNRKVSMNQACIDIIYDGLVDTAIDEVIVDGQPYRVVRCGEHYAAIWGYEFIDHIPAVDIVTPEVGVLWFNTKEAAVAEASAMTKEKLKWLNTPQSKEE